MLWWGDTNPPPPSTPTGIFKLFLMQQTKTTGIYCSEEIIQNTTLVSLKMALISSGSITATRIEMRQTIAVSPSIWA